MSLKSTIIERRMRKAATPGELYFADRLIVAAKELLATLHDDRTVSDREKLGQYATELARKLQILVTELEESAKNEATNAKNEVKTASQQAIDRVTQAVEAVLTDVERFRGPQGRPGVDGRDGKPGKPGEKGEKGADGSPDTPEQVAEKVNKAGGVKISAITGLSDELRKAKRDTGGGKGGGMGNTQHETYPLSASSTSITLNYSPANDGRAIWFHYQGQYMVYGTHYTVSGRTVTLLFTPTDGTYADILYIR